MFFGPVWCMYVSMVTPPTRVLQLLNLCEAEDAGLMKLACYKSLPSLVPLRIAALSEYCVCLRERDCTALGHYQCPTLPNIPSPSRCSGCL